MSNLAILKETLSAAARRLGVDLRGDALTEELLRDLDPSDPEALVATRDAIALQVGLSAVKSGDAADAELRGIILGVLAGVLA